MRVWLGSALGEIPREAATHLEARLRARFGARALAKEGDPFDAVVVVAGPDDLEPVHPRLVEGLEAARHHEVPLYVVTVGDAIVPASAPAALLEAPRLEPDELLLVLGHLDGSETSPPLPVAPRARPSPARPASSASSSPARARGFWARRDPILLKIAGTSGAFGLILLATVGLGGASLFLFLSAVSFLISSEGD